LIGRIGDRSIGGMTDTTEVINGSTRRSSTMTGQHSSA
jgi:hypothetical protein